MAVVDEPSPGFECVLYYNSATNASPTWVPMPMVRSLSESEGYTKIDISTRASPNKKYFAGQADCSVSFDYLYRKGTTDAVFTFMQTSKDARTAVQFAIADGPIATVGTEYSKDYYQITKFDKKQDLDGVMMFDVELSPTLYVDSGTVIDKTYVTVAS